MAAAVTRAEEIARLYVEERLSMPQIGQRLGLHHTTVLYYLRSRGVPRRSLSEAVALHPPTDHPRWLPPMSRDQWLVYKRLLRSYKIPREEAIRVVLGRPRKSAASPKASPVCAQVPQANATEYACPQDVGGV